MGNSEVGHLNLGAGRGRDAGPDADRRGGRRRRAGRRTRCCARRSRGAERVHLIGLVSDGGVHSGFEHLQALIELGGRARASPDLVLHAFTDGRDTLPHSGAGYLATVEGWMAEAGAGRIGIGGRALLRDGPRPALGPRPARLRPARPRPRRAHRRDRGRRRRAEAYARGETDEFITPVLVGEEARIRPGDSVIAFNFRPDRMREITRALAEPGFSRDRPRRRRRRGALRDDDRVRGGLAVPGRVPAGTHPTIDAAVVIAAARRRASCTSPRPRSTRT